MATQRPINEQFSDSYSQKGIQPSTGNISQVRNVNAKYKNDPKSRRGGRSKRAINNPDYNQAIKESTKQTKEIVEATMQAAAEEANLDAIRNDDQIAVGGNNTAHVVTPTNREPTKKISRRPQRLSKRKISIPPSDIFIARLRATTVNTGIWSWGIFTWITFQITFAMLTIVFFGAGLAVESITGVKKGDGFVVSGVKDAANTFVNFLDAALKLVGVDLAIFNPITFFMLANLVVIAFGFLILIIIYLIYKLASLNPLSGKRAGLKQGMLLLAIIGYSIPFLNLFPWFIPWTIAVWRYPK